jgi:hypothetical protein
LNGAVVDENVLSRGTLHEAETFGIAKPFHRTLFFHGLLLLGLNTFFLSRATGVDSLGKKPTRFILWELFAHYHKAPPTRK